MTETPKCPYCGMGMELKYVCGEYFCLCEACEATSPMGTSKEAALSAALHRAEPEMRPLTLDEVMELGKDDDSIVYITDRRFGECGWHHPVSITYDSATFEKKRKALHFYEPANDYPEFWPEAEYGKSWRCWPRKPTPEQMEDAKWEE